MADTVNFFNTLKERAESGEFSSAAGNVFQFNIANAGQWYIDLKNASTVCEGVASEADCTIATDKETFDAMLEDPMQAMAAFMSGKLTTDNLGLAMQLQAFLG